MLELLKVAPKVSKWRLSDINRSVVKSRGDMTRHFSSIVFGCLGLCVGFALCYVCGVAPTTKATSPKLVAMPARSGDTPDWWPFVMQPMIPPRIVGKYSYSPETE
jgi:hypothetical protein